MSAAPQFAVTLTASDLEAIEMGLDLLRKSADADKDMTTMRQVGVAHQHLADAVGLDEVSLDAGRLSIPSDVAAWGDACKRMDNPEGRRRNSETLREIVSIHRPTTTEKGQH